MSLAASDTDIANMAISNLGSGKEIGSMTGDNSQEAKACLRYYETARQMTLRDSNWGFARATVPLALVTNFMPKVYPNEWNFSYQYPANALIVRRLLSGNRFDTLDSAVPFQLQEGTNGTLIFTDMMSPSAEITILVEAVELYPPDFVLAFSHLLSALIAPRITNGDPLGLGVKAYQKYQMYVATAQKNDAIENGQDVEHDSDMVRIRNL